MSESLSFSEREADSNATGAVYDPGHILPQADWDRVVAEAEKIQQEQP